jgi:hypothetical protein
MGIRPDTVRHLVNRTLRTAENRAVEGMRELENARLDRARAAIWSGVLAGDYRAVMVFLQISARRARLNSLDSPAALDKLNATAQRHLDDEEQNIVPPRCGDTDPAGVGRDGKAPVGPDALQQEAPRLRDDPSSRSTRPTVPT